jgi:hypothetical protein
MGQVWGHDAIFELKTIKTYPILIVIMRFPPGYHLFSPVLLNLLLLLAQLAIVQNVPELFQIRRDYGCRLAARRLQPELQPRSSLPNGQPTVILDAPSFCGLREDPKLARGSHNHRVVNPEALKTVRSDLSLFAVR